LKKSDNVYASPPWRSENAIDSAQNTVIAPQARRAALADFGNTFVLAYPRNAAATMPGPISSTGFHGIGCPKSVFAAASSAILAPPDSRKVSNGATIDCEVIANSGIPLLISVENISWYGGLFTGSPGFSGVLTFKFPYLLEEELDSWYFDRRRDWIEEAKRVKRYGLTTRDVIVDGWQ
jgi:hypothetical protein